MNKYDYIRDRSRLIQMDYGDGTPKTGAVEQFKSINAAKRQSRELQKQGKVVRTAESLTND